MNLLVGSIFRHGARLLTESVPLRSTHSATIEAVGITWSYGTSPSRPTPYKTTIVRRHGATEMATSAPHKLHINQRQHDSEPGVVGVLLDFSEDSVDSYSLSIHQIPDPEFNSSLVNVNGPSLPEYKRPSMEMPSTKSEAGA